MLVYPHLVSYVQIVLVKLDYIIGATKHYDIEESLMSIQKCLKKNTIVLPLYNGVDAKKLLVLYQIMKFCRDVFTLFQ
jgi:2-dehydropantoate 2-reductase